jgi:hypothetical protein
VTFTMVGLGEKEGVGEAYLVRNPGSLISVSRIHGCAYHCHCNSIISTAIFKTPKLDVTYLRSTISIEMSAW